MQVSSLSQMTIRKQLLDENRRMAWLSMEKATELVQKAFAQISITIANQ